VDPITIAAAATRSAVAIANAAGMGDWLKQKFAGKPGLSAAGRIIDLATGITGTSDPIAALEVIKHDAQAREETERLLRAMEQELIKLECQDRYSARTMYVGQHENADKIARQIMTWNLPAIVALVGANCGAVYTIDNPTIAVALGNIIGASITYLWAERSQVVGFFFGSSLGSKDKSAMLSKGA
jgi:hypothetical protein